MRSPEDLLKISEEVNRAREKYLDAKQISDRLERGKHSKFASIFVTFPTSASAESRKQMTYASKEWKEYEDSVNLAKDLEVQAQKEWDTSANTQEALRSFFAYQREAMRNLG